MPEAIAKSKGAVRREQILEAAEQVFGQRGYWATTTEEVAKEVGISQPALYRYFESKRQLFMEALALRQQAILDAYQAAVRADATPLEKVRLAGEAMVELVRKYPNMARLRIHALALAAADDEMRPLVLQTVRTMIALHSALLRSAIEAGELPAEIDPDYVAGMVSGQTFNMYLLLCLGHENADPDRALEINNHLARIVLGRDDLGG